MSNNPTYKILVIDDSSMERQLTSLIFEKKGYQVITLEDSREAIKVIELNKPDIVLLDIMIPFISGNELLAQIRMKWNATELPVIMVTSKSDSEDIVKSFKIGANDYMVKPLSFDVALIRVETQIQLSRIALEVAKIKEYEAVKAVVRTYCHELNNPLTIALGMIDLMRENPVKEDHVKLLESTMWRMADVVKRLKESFIESDIKFELDSSKSKFLKF